LLKQLTHAKGSGEGNDCILASQNHEDNNEAKTSGADSARADEEEDEAQRKLLLQLEIDRSNQ
jgi:hypothetical protein